MDMVNIGDYIYYCLITKWPSYTKLSLLLTLVRRMINFITY